MKVGNGRYLRCPIRPEDIELPEVIENGASQCKLNRPAKLESSKPGASGQVYARDRTLLVELVEEDIEILQQWCIFHGQDASLSLHHPFDGNLDVLPPLLVCLYLLPAAVESA